MLRSTVCLSFDFDALSVRFAYERVTPAMLGRFVGHCREAGATFVRMGDVARALDGGNAG